ncbi:MAG: RND family efflux transporter MFP subunit [Arenicella sp.]|jgi:RND family efflux transporter MFP subunit
MLDICIKKSGKTVFEQELSRSEKIKRSKFFLPILLLVAASGIAALAIIAKPEVVKEESEFPPLVVEVSQANLDEELRSSAFQGEVRAKTDIELVTQVTGKVTQVSEKFIEGGQFSKGEMILQIDDADYRVALKLAQASVAEASVELDIEKASAETNKREWQNLVGESIEKANPLRLNKPQVQRARARLDAAKAQLAQARLDYDRTKISAPFDGRIMTKSAELGQFVARGSSIGRVFSTDSAEIRIAMSDTQISELGLSLGQIPDSAEAIPARVSTRFGSNNYLWQGYLRSIDASVDSETRLLFGTVVVDQPFEIVSGNGFPLAPGLYVDVELDAAEKVAGVSVPRTALRSGTTVYVVQDGKIKFKKVNTIFTSPQVAVLSIGAENSVLPGDLVVTSPVPAAFDGMPVKIKENKQQLVVNNDDDPLSEGLVPDSEFVENGLNAQTTKVLTPLATTEQLINTSISELPEASLPGEQSSTELELFEEAKIEPVKTLNATDSGLVEQVVTPI